MDNLVGWTVAMALFSIAVGLVGIGNGLFRIAKALDDKNRRA